MTKARQAPTAAPCRAPRTPSQLANPPLPGTASCHPSVTGIAHRCRKNADRDGETEQAQGGIVLSIWTTGSRRSTAGQRQCATLTNMTDEEQVELT